MIKYFLNAISNGLAFSKVEAKGTFILVILVILMLLSSKIANNYFRSGKPIATDSLALAQWVQQVEASYSLKSAPVKQLYKESTTKISTSQPTKKTDKPHRTVKKSVSVRDLNKATPSDLQEIRGIGKVYSERIVKYRERLGGFASESQIGEVYGMDSTLVTAITNRFNIQSGVTSIPINSDSAKVLAKHPYISYDLAWLIINYRKQNGDISTISDLSLIKAIDDSLLQKLSPYISE